ncbi:alpha/beta fold hydrolase [Pseudalkalibacillus decolorationis]|uniref:alpha/beta fold hydrolase n=1 Tax=Pseudalkalibacillus decolorationis TaxID=163879 RepID=UPI00214859D7|nr:alpha/beta hydrolase [Pseudalkalibacillus decolorationis]
MKAWQTQIIKTERGTFEVFTKGHGNPLCVTHLYSDFNCSGDHFADTFTVRHKVILVNLKGAGQSDQPQSEDEYSMEETVKDLEAIRDSMDIERWAFAGHSTGGMLGLLYGIRYPESISQLIVVGSAASGNYADESDCIYHQDHPKFNDMQDVINKLKLPCLHPDERKLLSRQRTRLSLYRPERYERYFSAKIFKKIAVERLDYFAEKEFPLFDYRVQLRELKVPTLIICGEHDVQCPIRCSYEMNRLIPTSTFLCFQESNHYPFLEEKERFQFAIHSFLL